MNSVKRSTQPSRNRGSVTVEMAVTLPLMTLLVLGTADAGHFANAYQIVSDASREGARIAALATTSSSSQVNESVGNYLAVSFDSDNLANATVNVRDASGQLVESFDELATGSRVQVEVILPYADVRIFPGIPMLTDQNLRATCVMLRQ